MAQVDTFGLYVAGRLEEWGEVFALHRDGEYLGHASQNMLQRLIDHRGEMPPPNVGFKPLEIPHGAMQIEDIITDMARSDMGLATVMRAYYCGRGRRSQERLDLCNQRLQGHGLPALRREAYRVAQMRGFDWVRGVLIGMARAA